MSADASVEPPINDLKTTSLVIAVFIAIFGSLTIASFTRQSPTVDEPIHLLGGYSYLKRGDFRINPEHPPLVKAWAALPLLWLKVNDPHPSSVPASQSASGESNRFYPLAQEIFFRRNDATTLFFYGRLQMVFVGILLGLFIYLWSREFFGIAAGVVSLFVFAFDPNILAHSGVIHTDLPFAAVYFVGTYFFWRLLQNFNGFNLVVTSVCLGLALITKYTYVWIAPAWFLLASIKILSAEPLKVTLGAERFVADRAAKAGLLALGFLSCAIVAYVIVWSAYGFRFFAAGDAPSFQINAALPGSTLASTVLPLVARYHLFPEAWTYGHSYVLNESTRNMYFFGEISNRGFWSYFPVAFLIKTPLPTIIILVAAIGAWMKKPRWRTLALILLAPAVVYFLAAVAFRFNIGVRHLLPVYPFLFVLIGGFVVHVWRMGSRAMRGALVGLAIWSLWSPFSVYPHLLSYFNELTGGAKNGHKVLLDSNLDWGQDLIGLKKWMDARDVKRIQLFYFGAAEPKYYGIDDFYSAENLFGGAAAVRREIDLPEHLVISANFLYGRELFFPDDMVKLLASYRLEKPVARIGYSIYVFRLNLADSRAYENAAFITARKGALSIATSLLEKALQINPASANGYFQSGALLAQRGEWDRAAENFREALRLKPDHADAHYGLAQIFKRQGRIDEAARHYQEALGILKEDKAGTKSKN